MSPINLTLSVAAVALLLFAIGASAALADDHDGDEAAFGDGTYVLVIPGVGDFEFEVDSEGEETVVAVMAPEGYGVDDDHPDKATWKDAAGLEVEMKLDKIESKVAWSEGSATLNIHGGWIAVSKPDAEGNFTVTGGGDWTAFGDGSDWIVANDADIGAADKFFRVEATADGIEVKLVSEPGDGFLNDLDDEDEDEENEEEGDEEEEDEGEGDEEEEDDD